MWGPWGEGPCNQDDCVGILNKVRACNSPPPALNGADCDDSVLGETELGVICNADLGECPGRLKFSNKLTCN